MMWTQLVESPLFFNTFLHYFFFLYRTVVRCRWETYPRPGGCVRTGWLPVTSASNRSVFSPLITLMNWWSLFESSFGLWFHSSLFVHCHFTMSFLFKCVIIQQKNSNFLFVWALTRIQLYPTIKLQRSPHGDPIWSWSRISLTYSLSMVSTFQVRMGSLFWIKMGIRFPLHSRC